MPRSSARLGSVRIGVAALALVTGAACGSKKRAPAGGSGSGGSGATTVAPLTVPPLGVDAVKRFNYLYGPAAKDDDKVIASYKVKPRDWGAIKAAALATLAKDPDHLDARWALGEALANSGDPAGAADALLTALAADWLRWGPGLAQDPDLATFLATAQGKALVEASMTLGAAVDLALASEPLILARRSIWKLPAPGTSYAATRGEVYAYDLDQKRFLRVTHTDHTVAAVLRAPSGELLLAGYTQAQVFDPAKLATNGQAGGAANAPLLTKSWVSAWNPKDHTVTAAPSAVPKARYVWAGYGPGEQVLVMTALAATRWNPGTFTTYAADRTTGKLTRSGGGAIDGPHIQMSLDDVEIIAGSGWPSTLAPGAADKLAAVVSVDDHGVPRLETMAPSATGGRIAFATATDPCNDQDDAAKPSLYVADAMTGAYKHVLTAASRFAVEWIDDDRLLYEDGSGSLRIYDAAAGREIGKLGERAGFALHVLPPGPAPLCRTEPPVSDPSATDDLPPEEPAADPAGPATTP